ncbi:hypothetical protein [Paenibacillus harenae]|uniref:Uncharacterized protein n=1 Tax=Paenibacillus harenae TaxID=306543 RepID=A0ABT9TYU5_PAEHA|nr:hypothetical protein [Paenibacillus harenae]MDQ0112547.1 hypothetical protein [Paenibacillus harenae]
MNYVSYFAGNGAKNETVAKEYYSGGLSASVGLLSDGTVMAVGRVDEILKIKGDLREMFIEFETSEQTMQS